MKRFAALTAALLMLTGCSQTIENTNDSEPDENTSSAADTTSEGETDAVQPTTKETPPYAESKLRTMSLRQKVCQMFIVTPEELTGYEGMTYVDDTLLGCCQIYPVGGFILFNQNIMDGTQLATFTGDLQYVSKNNGIGAFISADEEGGSVTRVQSALWTEAVNDMSFYGANNDAAGAEYAGGVLGSTLRDYGFNLDFAPVADVNLNSGNELGSRIFSSDPAVVSQMSAAVIKGLHSQNVCATLKHFPGLGAGSGNTHEGSVKIDRTLDQLRSCEFTAFQGGIEADADFVMVGHQITSASGDDLPGDLSKVVVTDWLRNELNFQGIIISDSHSMGAITSSFTPADAAVKAIEAGVDIILMPSDIASAVNGIEGAVLSGNLSEERINESVLRILSKKYEMGLI